MVISFFYFGYVSEIDISADALDNILFIVVIEAIIGVAMGLSLTFGLVQQH